MVEIDTIEDAWTLDVRLCEAPEAPEYSDCPLETVKCRCGKPATVFMIGISATESLCQECAYPVQTEAEFESSVPVRLLRRKGDL